MQSRAATALLELFGRARRVLPDVRDRGRISIAVMGRITARKLSAYWHEVTFGWKATRTWPDHVALLLHTIQFHIRNGFGGANDSRSTIKIDLWIDRDWPTTLTLRPFAGDLFVLYEVLAFNVYHIAPSLLPTGNVRVIVDCGANIGITSLFLAARYPCAKILSVEPHPENFALLKANVETVPRILPIRACVTGTPKYGAIHYRSGGMGKSYCH
jgi:hypothetical protein